MPDATTSLKQRLREAFDAMQVGQTFTYRRTFTEGDVTLFCGVTGDFQRKGARIPILFSGFG